MLKGENKCSATSFLRNWDSILEKKRANLRSISEPARLRQPPPRSTGAAHARGRAQSIREERRIAAPPVLFALSWVRLTGPGALQRPPTRTARALSTSFAMLRSVEYRSIGAALAALPSGGEASAVWCCVQFVTPETNWSKGGEQALAARFYSTAASFSLSFWSVVCYA